MKVLNIVLGLGLVLSTGHAAQKLGVNFPDKLAIEGKTLSLNGLGVREATIFSVDVYVAGLYLETKNKNEKAILNSPSSKSIRMQFVRDVSAKDLQGAWKEGAERNCEENCAQHDANLKKLNALMKDIKEGQTMGFDFLPQKTIVHLGGKKNTIEGARFSKLLLSMWLKKPPNSGLKTGMLGLAE